MTNPNDGDFLAPAGSKWTITAMTAGLFVAFDNALNPEYATQANAAIKQVLLLNIGDAVTFFTPDGIKWDILSTAFTAAAAF